MSSEIEKWISRLPEAQELAKRLSAEVDAHLAALRTWDEQAHRPEDVFVLVREMARLAEIMETYGRAFTSGAKTARGWAEDTLIDAVGESDGIPLANLTVPDAEGDLKLNASHANEYDIDTDQLIAAISAMQGVDSDGKVSWGVLGEAMGQLLELGKFEPQVSKVRAFAAQLARQGEDQLAGAVTSAITKRQTYAGVKLSRTPPKKGT